VCVCVNLKHKYVSYITAGSQSVSFQFFVEKEKGTEQKKGGNFGSKFKKKRKITHHDGVQRHSRTILVSTTGRLERNGLRDIFPFDRNAVDISVVFRNNNNNNNNNNS